MKFIKDNFVILIAIIILTVSSIVYESTIFSYITALLGITYVFLIVFVMLLSFVLSLFNLQSTYNVVNQTDLSIEQVTVVVRNIFKWYSSGIGLSDIVTRLNDMKVPTPSKYKNTKLYCNRYNEEFLCRRIERLINKMFLP